MITYIFLDEGHIALKDKYILYTCLYIYVCTYIHMFMQFDYIYPSIHTSCKHTHNSLTHTHTPWHTDLARVQTHTGANQHSAETVLQNYKPPSQH